MGTTQGIYWINNGLSGFKTVTDAVREWVMKEQRRVGTEHTTSDGLLLIRTRPGKPGIWVCAGHTGHGMSWASVQHLPVMSPTPPQPGTTVAGGAHVGGVEFFSIY
ncbi:hypothetical protein D9758_016971 [Tetrapyrgos nigripes]|uniref:FAD dependent oxidoreductase domain-containing protein n=1 Tax=Tetrapyrgos nigripes TaxID=182062 RepID=A0A8H5FJE1_9AGAR|nr:hypothetical protein D9758_016971 [Tetrapyrgos nigripes]